MSAPTIPTDFTFTKEEIAAWTTDNHPPTRMPEQLLGMPLIAQGLEALNAAADEADGSISRNRLLWRATQAIAKGFARTPDVVINRQGRLLFVTRDIERPPGEVVEPPPGDAYNPEKDAADTAVRAGVANELLAHPDMAEAVETVRADKGVPIDEVDLNPGDVISRINGLSLPPYYFSIRDVRMGNTWVDSAPGLSL